MAVLSTVVFGTIGIILAIVGFKLFDKLTPGKLDEEILQKQNIAAAILAAAFILGICIIVAAAVHGGGWSRGPVPIHTGPSSPAPGATHPGGSSSTPRGGFGSTASHGSGIGA